MTNRLNRPYLLRVLSLATGAIVMICGTAHAQTAAQPWVYCSGTSGPVCSSTPVGIGTSNTSGQTLFINGPAFMTNNAGSNNTVAHGVLGVGDALPQPNTIVNAQGSATITGLSGNTERRRAKRSSERIPGPRLRGPA